ncbi:MAG: hypothetical protein AB2552_16280 [Candidatus Thiodiazotropha endolucinida]
MNISTHPEDSVLKRHFDATVEMKRQIWLQTPPTDSILHRHAIGMGNHPAARSTTRAKDTSSPAFNRSSSTATARQASDKNKGILSWLFGLFRSA